MDNATVKLPPYILEIVEEISSNEIAIKMSYPDRLSAKISILLGYLDGAPSHVSHFSETILFNISIKPSHLENALKFLDKLDSRQRQFVYGLIGLLWQDRDERLLGVALSEDKTGRTEAMKHTFNRLELIRKFLKGVPDESWDVKQLSKMSKALNLSIDDTMGLVEIRPSILRGLKKPLRPIYAWPLPTLIALMAYHFSISYLPAGVSYLSYLFMIVVLALSLWHMSTRVYIAPGILHYRKTKLRLNQALSGAWENSCVVEKMRAYQIEVEQFLRQKEYQFSSEKVRLEIRDRRTLSGAMQFLTSSEQIGNCIALRNFVSWCLPSLLNDESIMLCDISVKGSQRAQLWMIAAEKQGTPVLTVNSIEFNNSGAQYIEIIMPRIIEVLQDVSLRSGFKEIYVGISDFGRNWFDAHYPQERPDDPIYKVHCADLGYLYYFDAYRKHGFFGNRRYQYMQKRTLILRAYALIFGLIEKVKGNSNKSAAFFDSVKNNHNCWVVPVKPT